MTAAATVKKGQNKLVERAQPVVNTIERAKRIRREVVEQHKFKRIVKKIKTDRAEKTEK